MVITLHFSPHAKASSSWAWGAGSANATHTTDVVTIPADAYRGLNRWSLFTSHIHVCLLPQNINTAGEGSLGPPWGVLSCHWSKVLSFSYVHPCFYDFISLAIVMSCYHATVLVAILLSTLEGHCKSKRTGLNWRLITRGAATGQVQANQPIAWGPQSGRRPPRAANYVLLCNDKFALLVCSVVHKRENRWLVFIKFSFLIFLIQTSC